MTTRSSTTKKSTPKKPRTTKSVTTDRTSNGPIYPLGHLLVAKLLKEAGFKGAISTDPDLLDSYSTDESIFCIRPQVVLQPKNRTDIEIATRVVSENAKEFPTLSLTPRAAGTGLSGGSLTDSVIIDVSKHMTKVGVVTEKKKGQFTVECEPGAMWRDVEKKLKRHGAYIPSFPASKDICSIGGAVANNSAGPDSLRFGHCAEWIKKISVTLHDGYTYNIKPLSYREYKLLIKQDHEHARIAKAVFAIISKNEKTIQKSRPQTTKNSAGFALWDVLPDGFENFKKGIGKFDLTRLFAGSQGTIGVITSVTMKAIPIPKHTTTLVIPIFNLQDATDTVVKSLTHNPINVELFDDLTFNLALKNPTFFKDRLSASDYYRVMLAMYTTYHVRFRRKVPAFTVLVTLDEETIATITEKEIINSIRSKNVKPYFLRNKQEQEMYWQIRHASYTLSKFQDKTKRPAAFLEDMTVPPENLSKFFKEIKKLLNEFKVTAAVHGHGGNGHLHFYPLLDFTNTKTPALVEKMSERFFKTAIKHNGNICGEHNDGIIRTPHLDKIFTKKTIALFERTEATFDPLDIFNPGKKVNPRFDIKNSVRKTN